MQIDIIAARIDERYAMPMVINRSRVAFPLKLVMEGATHPMMMSGTMKKMTWLVICLTISRPCTVTALHIPDSGETKIPRRIPATMAIANSPAVLCRNLSTLIFCISRYLLQPGSTIGAELRCTVQFSTAICTELRGSCKIGGERRNGSR